MAIVIDETRLNPRGAGIDSQEHGGFPYQRFPKAATRA
jgi:hypothetical protein